jgi:hypothetical protein
MSGCPASAASTFGYYPGREFVYFFSELDKIEVETCILATLQRLNSAQRDFYSFFTLTKAPSSLRKN